MVILGVCSPDTPSSSGRIRSSYLLGPGVPPVSPLSIPRAPGGPCPPIPWSCHCRLLSVCLSALLATAQPPPSVQLAGVSSLACLPGLALLTKPSHHPPPFPLCSLPISPHPLPPPLSEMHQWQPIPSATSSLEPPPPARLSPLPKSVSRPYPQGGTRPFPLPPPPGHTHSFTRSLILSSPQEPPTHCGHSWAWSWGGGLGPKEESIHSNHSEDLLRAWPCHLTPCHSPEP